ncbi:hypothetical protein [Paenibacillus sp. UNC496MF]|uniref:hypothetical protein n=1 Tax=Paenibacillus sp. UNC496MF TaxID=1502753 RepID=UPI0011605E0C|nr:hypothetical protein [Paenibacillus sp. UNC496MF]
MDEVLQPAPKFPEEAELIAAYRGLPAGRRGLSVLPRLPARADGFAESAVGSMLRILPTCAACFRAFRRSVDGSRAEPIRHFFLSSPPESIYSPANDMSER